MGKKIVKIIEKDKTEDGIFQAEVVFPSENCYVVTVKNPFIEKGEIEPDQEERLRWYFEDHLASPFTDREKAKRAEKSIAFYGESLFAHLFAQNEALTEWRNLVNGLDKIRVQVFSQDPGFQALHWESLKDPKEKKAFCLTGVEFTRTSGAVTADLKVRESACLNLLMVTARPGGKDDVEYRTITRPVIETIEKNRVRVRFHLLRPPTFEALKEHLRDKKGVYHILHFDVHGCVLSFPEYKGLMEKQKQKAGGVRRAVAPYEGTRAFIDLVGEKGGHDPVLADFIAELLKEAHIPVCFLNACQSGMATWKVSKAEDEPGEKEAPALILDASLAMTFLERGVKLVLGMAWSLTVIGAKIMMKTLYNALTRGEDPGTALNLARVSMFDQGCRFSSTDLRVVLEDWLLPVVWGKGDFSLHLQLKKENAEQRLAYLEQEKVREKELEGVKTEGRYGFLGRDVDILTIESFLPEKNILLIEGMGGTGKTTLMGHMAQWWMKTGWIDHVFYFGYDRKSYHAEEIVNTIAEIVMPRGEYGRFLVIPDVETKAMDLAAFLKKSKETPAVLLILDNMESVTGTKKAVGSRLKKGEQDKLAGAIKSLMQSSIKILLGSRSDEAWLGKQTFKESIYVLEGLDRVSRFDLSEKILEGTPIENRDEFNRLMDILAGYPLAMEIILPNLGQQSAKELREVLTGAGIDLKGGTVSEEIFKCINISFSLLTPKAKKSFLVFAPFTSFFNGMFLENYLKELQVSEPFTHLTLADLEEALNQGVKQGLLKEVFPQCFSIQPVFPFFLGQQVEQSLDETGKAVLEKAFCSCMTSIANTYNDLMESKKSGEKQLGFILFKQDRENLYKALHRVLDNQGDFYLLYIVFTQFYHQHPLYHEAVEFMEGVVKKLDLFSKKGKTFLENYAYVVGNLGTNYQKIKNFSGARENYKKALTLLNQAGMRQQTSTAYHQLGWVAQEERDWEEAKRNYLEALKIFQEFNDRYSQAGTFHQLGMVAEEEKDYAASLEYYALALEIYHQYNDEYRLKITIENLSELMEEWDAAEAIERLEKEEETKNALRTILEKVKEKE